MFRYSVKKKTTEKTENNGNDIVSETSLYSALQRYLNRHATQLPLVYLKCTFRGFGVPLIPQQ